MRRNIMPLRWLVLVGAVAALNLPVIVTLVTSFKSDAEIAANPSLMIESPTVANYVRIFAMSDRFDILHYLTNSVIEAAIGTALALTLAFPAAYGMIRFRVGLTLLFPQVVNQRAIPLIIFAIPIYLMYQAAGLLDTRFGLALILCLVNLPLVLVLLVNAVRDVPIELDEAARIDGAGPWKILLSIVLPLVRPMIASSTVLAFIYAWNEFLFGLMLTTRAAIPVTVGASFFFSASGGGVQWGVAAAVMMLSTLPPMLLGLFAYRHIGRSMTAGAIKG
jgi:multiple sugar transport system permease protein